MNKVITVASLKGGVAKTTTSLGLVAAAVEAGEHVVLIDLDPGRGSSKILGVDGAANTVLGALQGGPVEASATSCDSWPVNVTVFPGDRRLSVRPAPAEGLARIVEWARNRADLVVVDTENTQGSLSVPLGVADRIVIPLFPDLLGIRGAEETLGFVEHLGLIDRVGGIVFTQVPARVEKMVRATMSYYQDTVRAAYRSTISRGVAWQNFQTGTRLSDRARDECVALLNEVRTTTADRGGLNDIAVPYGVESRYAALPGVY